HTRFSRDWSSDVCSSDLDIPIFGVCLGLQSIGQAFGGDVVRAPQLMHGKVSTIHHTAQGVFRGINDGFEATRYHSLVVAPETLPDRKSVVQGTGVELGRV